MSTGGMKKVCIILVRLSKEKIFSSPFTNTRAYDIIKKKKNKILFNAYMVCTFKRRTNEKIENLGDFQPNYDDTYRGIIHFCLHV